MSELDRMDVRFRGAMFGYNKSDVDGYAQRMESELEIQQTRCVKMEQQVAELQKELQRTRSLFEDATREVRELREKDTGTKRVVDDLKTQLAAARQEADKETRRNEELKQELEVTGVDRQMIQDAILNAQRLSSGLVEEARAESAEILRQAEETRREQEEAARRVLQQADQDAEERIQAAQDKCDALQQDYDRILIDVTDFKMNMLQMYREHMSRLLALPEKKPLELECVDMWETELTKTEQPLEQEQTQEQV